MMNNQNPIFAYQQSTVHGASPVGQVVALYDTILRDFRRALAAIEAGNVETRVFETNHAITVIAHLQNVLDHERGGEAAKHLESFYKVTRGMIVEASVNSASETLRKLIDLYTSMRQAWQEVAQKLPAGEVASPASAPVATPPVRATIPPSAGVTALNSARNGTNDEMELPRARWSA